MRRLMASISLVLIALGGGNMVIAATAQARSATAVAATVQARASVTAGRKLAGGSGQCEVTGLKVKGNGSKKKQCTYRVRHGDDSVYGLRTDLQNKCDRLYTEERDSLFLCWKNLYANRYVSYGFGADPDSKTRFSTELTLARCLNPRGANVRCPYMHVKLRNIDGRSSYTITIKCGSGTGKACNVYGIAAHQPNYNGVSNDYYASSRIWTVAGDKQCRTHLGGIQYASAFIHGRWARTKGVPQRVRYTARWRACDSTD